jgi:hypothetical protein
MPSPSLADHHHQHHHHRTGAGVLEVQRVVGRDLQDVLVEREHRLEHRGGMLWGGRREVRIIIIIIIIIARGRASIMCSVRGRRHPNDDDDEYAAPRQTDDYSASDSAQIFSPGRASGRGWGACRE